MWITNKFARGRAHLMRATHDSIITSYKTIIEDNPKLNCRITGLENQSPARIIIDKNDNVLLIDDLIATGGTAEAAAKLIEMSEGNVAGYVFVINLFDLDGCDKLIKKGYKVENLIEFPGH